MAYLKSSVFNLFVNEVKVQDDVFGPSFDDEILAREYGGDIIT